ncbi:MAG: rod shape-determining protein MreC [bacterium]|nr:rod shape-determining protein MreC [bacterium]
MTYLRDSERKRREGGRLAAWLPVAMFALLAGAFTAVPALSDRAGGMLASAASAISGGDRAFSLRALIAGREALLRENDELKMKLATLESADAELAAVRSENEALKAALGREGKRDLLLAVVLLKPPRSPYDTLLIDAGARDGVLPGERVFADGDVLIGEVARVDGRTSLVSLYSSPGRRFDARVGAYDFEAVGEGGGEFEATVPKALEVSEGDEVIAPSLHRIVLGRVAGIRTDERNPLKLLIIASPVSVYGLTRVYIER